jgi:hypothetical protein
VSDIRLVLDTSALLSYARLEGMAVGELLAMLEEEDDRSLVGVPVGSFLAAYRALAPDERAVLTALVTRADGVVVILPLLGSDAVEVAALDDRLGRDGIGHAIVETRHRDATLATYDLRAALSELPDDAVVDLGLE